MRSSNRTQDTTPAVAAPEGGSEIHTASAARQFLRAVRHDLAALLRRVASSAPKPGAPGWGRHSKGSNRKLLMVLMVVAVSSGVGLLMTAGTMLWVLHDLPLDEPGAKGGNRSIALEASDGKPLGRLGPVKFEDAPREAFPDLLVKAVLSIEDRRFYEHRGIDLLGIIRAARRNYDAGTIVEGGSTITQQLVKLRYLGNERNYKRKLREAFLAVWLELRLSKDEILTRYLNGIYLGSGAEGVPAAAQLYFDKTPSALTLSECALLAGLIKAPSRFNPRQNPGLAYERAAQVLDAMAETGAIDRNTTEEAKRHPAALHPPAMASASGTWFSDWVAQEALEVTGGFRGQIRVRTTLVAALQSLAEQVLVNALQKNADRNVSEAALVAMRPDGAVVAMVGGRDYREGQFNRAVQAKRQPGSAFELFVYLAALRNGFELEDTIDASAPEVDGWVPGNYEGRHFGTVTLADAFARSINTVAVRLALTTGLDKVIAAARDLGIDTPLPKVPSLALGSPEVSLLDLTAAYAAVLAGRAPVRPWGVASFASPIQPRLISVGPLTGTRKPLGDLQETLTELLRLPVARGTAREAALDGFAAGKTGTTQDDRDAWFIGFNESLVVGIWVGNDDHSPMRDVTGGSLPAVVWKDFMTKAASQVSIDKGAPVTGERAPGTSEEPPQAATCDYRACAAKYQSFDADDCTYQPHGGGQRRQCPFAAKAAAQDEFTTGVLEEAAPSSEWCNVDACAETYSSFRRQDCTYQPYDGGARRLCQR